MATYREIRTLRFHRSVGSDVTGRPNLAIDKKMSKAVAEMQRLISRQSVDQGLSVTTQASCLSISACPVRSPGGSSADHRDGAEVHMQIVLDQFRMAEGGLRWAHEWLVLRAVSRCQLHDLPRAPMPTFTPHQDSALNAVADWLKAKPGQHGTPPILRLFGYAVTGKTALVMRNKGCDNASTIHSLIYRARESGVEQPSFELWDDAPASKAKLIVIDECSMVDAELGRDLMSFECPLLVLGDPAQLPPIQGGGYFTACEPDAMLTEVHRQAQNDPIVRMSMDIREGRELKIGRYGESEVVSRAELDPDRVMRADQVLVGRNNTRRSYNMRMRQKQHIEDPLPVTGDKLVCLRNNRKKGLFNGGLWRVKSRAASKSKIITMRLSPDEDFGHKVTKVSVRGDCFGGAIETIPWEQRKPYDEFDFGYVLTVHKAQGSQWDDVVLFDESFAFQESRERWLYTGVTRAAKKLTLRSEEHTSELQ